ILWVEHCGTPTVHLSAINIPSRPTLRRIPKGVRAKAASLFETRLRTVWTYPNEVRCWNDLFLFTDCLTQPSRGSRRQNLTSLIATQIDRAAQGIDQPRCSQ